MVQGLGLTMMVIWITQFSHELSLVINNVNPFPLELVASAVRDCAARALLTTRQQWRLISLTAVALTNLTSCLPGPLNKCEVLQKLGITLSSAAGDFPGPGRGDWSTHDRVPICNIRHLYEQKMHINYSHKAHLCQFWRKSVNMLKYGSRNIQLDKRTVRLPLCDAGSHGGGHYSWYY